MDNEITYHCDRCGEEIVVPIDLSQGGQQDYVEDCPVCCHPNRIRFRLDDHGDAVDVDAELDGC